MSIEFNVSQCSQLIFFCYRIQFNCFVFHACEPSHVVCLARTVNLVFHCDASQC